MHEICEKINNIFFIKVLKKEMRKKIFPSQSKIENIYQVSSLSSVYIFKLEALCQVPAIQIYLDVLKQGHQNNLVCNTKKQNNNTYAGYMGYIDRDKE